MKLKAPAKINLSLDILGKDKKGFHKMRTVFHEIKTIYDKIEITPVKNKDIFQRFVPPKIGLVNTRKANFTNFSQTPRCIFFPQSEDMISKALALVKKTFKINNFVKIKVKKRIPFASGLGGGSSDAAAVLKGLNELWELKQSKPALAKLAAKLGMDVPFFIYGGTALGENYGEKITPLPEIKNIKFNIYPRKTPSINEKTKRAYQKLNLKKCGKNLKKTTLLVKGIRMKNKKLILENIHNDFETILANPLPKNRHLTGAGPTTFTAS